MTHDSDNGRAVLCQDCLAVAPYTDARHNEDEFCACGGQWCGCDMCLNTVRQLRAGERRAVWLGLTCEDLGFWCEATGIRAPETPFAEPF